MLGILVGSLTILILQFTPISMDDINQWQYQNQKERDAYVWKLNLYTHTHNETFYNVCTCYRFFIKEQKNSTIYKYDNPPELMEHEKRLQKFKTDANKSS